MVQAQADLFAQAGEEHNGLSEPARHAVRERLEAALGRLAAATKFPWPDPLDAVHEENRFERDSEMLGEEGAALWARFDREMDRLHLMRS